MHVVCRVEAQFPFLFGGTFIEGPPVASVKFKPCDFPSFSEGLSLRAKNHLTSKDTVCNFPSFSEGLSLRDQNIYRGSLKWKEFPFLFGGTFIEGAMPCHDLEEGNDFPSFSEGLSLRDYGGDLIHAVQNHFPSFSEGLSLREVHTHHDSPRGPEFPFLFGGTFIEGPQNSTSPSTTSIFPFLFGGTFIEGSVNAAADKAGTFNFPSFSEGLSLRDAGEALPEPTRRISLPFRRDFH